MCRLGATLSRAARWLPEERRQGEAEESTPPSRGRRFIHQLAACWRVWTNANFKDWTLRSIREFAKEEKVYCAFFGFTWEAQMPCLNIWPEEDEKKLHSYLEVLDVAMLLLLLLPLLRRMHLINNSGLTSRYRQLINFNFHLHDRLWIVPNRTSLTYGEYNIQNRSILSIPNSETVLLQCNKTQLWRWNVIISVVLAHFIPSGFRVDLEFLLQCVFTPITPTIQRKEPTKKSAAWQCSRTLSVSLWWSSTMPPAANHSLNSAVL